MLAERYLVEEQLGRGATGTVYRARHVKVGRPFAVKVLHAALAGDPTTLRRFEREAELAGRLRHANVIPVVDVGDLPDGGRFMVMELAHGVGLGELIASEAPLAPARALALIDQLLAGLEHAHERGVLHRDLKPDNVIVENREGVELARIVDFGIAIARDEAQAPASAHRLTTGGIVLGTPHYMSPEHALGNAMDHRIDLFAIGVIAYEMLSGAMPFDGSGVDVARANLSQPVPKMCVRRPGLEIDPRLEAFVVNMMAKRADHRPATATAARELLHAIARDREVAPRALGVELERPVPPPMPVVPAADAEPLARVVPLTRELAPPAPRRAPWLCALAMLPLGALAMAVAAAPPPPAARAPLATLDADEPLPWSVSLATHEPPPPPARLEPVTGTGSITIPVTAAKPVAPPARTPAAASTSPDHAPTADDVVHLYVAVGHLLLNTTDDTARNTFRRIRITQAIASEANRRETATQLAMLQARIARSAGGASD
nr:serine/threonine-protein kinase [Kofleriaceae bacterium]